MQSRAATTLSIKGFEILESVKTDVSIYAIHRYNIENSAVLKRF